VNDLSPKDITLLVNLKKGRHFKANPGNLLDLLPNEEEPEALASFRRVLAAGLVKKVPSSDPGIWLRITDAGMAIADKEIEAARAPTFRERVSSMPIGKGAWDLLKVGLGAVLGALAVKYFGS